MRVALAWLLARSAVMLPIPGTESEHLEDNVRAAELKLAPADLKDLA
jgi:aryl-alcohol dehydrogenase-like predicted oxidoreductase